MDINRLRGRDTLPILRQPFPGLESLLQTLWPVWEQAVDRYYSLPYESREKLALLEAGKPREGPDLGFVDKSRELGHDDKLYFHWQPGVEEDIRDPAFAFLMFQSRELYESALRHSFLVVRAIEQSDPVRFAGLEEKVTVHRKHRLRLVWYKNGSGMLAQLHPDHSFLTNHLGETDPGLQVKWQDEFHPVAVNPDESCFFAGRKAPLATQGFIPKAVEHLVMSTLSPGKHRSAAVFFLHGPWPLPDTDH